MEITVTDTCQQETCCETKTATDLCEQAVREAAYFLWEEAGCPQSSGEEFWVQAEEYLQSTEE